MLKWLTGTKQKDGRELIRERGWTAILGTIFDRGCSGGIFPELDATKRLETYSTSAVIGACMNKIIQAFCEPPVVIGEYIDDEFQPAGDTVETLAIYELLERPNPQMQYDEFMRVVLLHYVLTGCIYVEKERDERGNIVALWPYPSPWVERVVDRNTRTVTAYKVRVPDGGSGDARVVMPENMMTLYVPSGCNPYCAESLLTPALHDYQTDVEREQYIAEMLMNTVSPGTVVKAPEGISDHEARTLKNKLEETAGRKLNRRGKTLILAGRNMDVTLSEPLKDLDWHGLSNLSESRICAVLGVPATIVGVRVGLENSPYSHIDHAVQIFYRETMVPYWKRFAQLFTRHLFRLEGDDRYEIRYDFKEVRQLAEDAQEVSTRVVGEWNAGLITRNQALQTLGYQVIDGELGDVIRVSVGAVELPIDSELPAYEPPEPHTDTEDETEQEQEDEQEATQ